MERQTASYQCGAQTPSLARGPAGQCSMRSVKARPASAQSARRWASRRAQEALAVDHQRRAAQALGHAVEQLGLLQQADVGRRAPRRATSGSWPPPAPGRGSGRRCAGACTQSSVHAGQQVVRHVLLVPDRPPVGHRAGEGVRTTRRQSVSPAAMTSSRAGWSSPVAGQVVRVQRLVADGAVAAVLPGPHQRGGDVARAAPHGDRDARDGPCLEGRLGALHNRTLTPTQPNAATHGSPHPGTRGHVADPPDRRRKRRRRQVDGRRACWRSTSSTTRSRFVGFDTDRSHGSLLRFYADYASPALVDRYEALDKIVESRGRTARAGACWSTWRRRPRSRWCSWMDESGVLDMADCRASRCTTGT